jgi:hypothetical protein
MVLDLAGQRVGFEWIGLARAFRSEVRAVDLRMERALVTVCAPLRERLRRKPRLRAEAPHDIARRYAELVPARFRIGAVEAARDRCDFASAPGDRQGVGGASPLR